MASLLPSMDAPVPADPPRSAALRRAFYLDSQGVPLFAWLHSAPSASQGVVICAPPGHEQVHTHRTLRHLAERLAEAGLCVVRFDRPTRVNNSSARLRRSPARSPEMRSGISTFSSAVNSGSR